jgi:hypothetical protein
MPFSPSGEHCHAAPGAVSWGTTPLNGHLRRYWAEVIPMPIDVTCPHCGKTTTVANEYAGQSGVCANCRKPITAPVSGCVAPFSATPGRRFPLESKALVGSFLFIPAVGIVIALLLPAVQAAREAARRMNCANHMTQISLAIHNYAQAHRCFPPAFIADKDGKPMHSWRVLILPYMELDSLYKQYRFDEPWNGPHNKLLATKIPLVYRCPSDGSPEFETSYAMIMGPHAFSDGPTSRSFDEIKDGMDNTIMLAECAGAGINWMEPRDLNTEMMTFHINDPKHDPGQPTVDISSGHGDSARVTFCSASGGPLPIDLDPDVLKAMMTIDGGEPIPPKD